MSDYYITQIRQEDSRGCQAVDRLLEGEGIRRDANLDYTCGMFDREGKLVATGSCFGSTLRCMAVSSSHQGEGLMNQILTHLMEIQVGCCNTHVFLYTKCDSVKFFRDLGFHEIARADNQVVFMENCKNGFNEYLDQLKAETPGGDRTDGSGAIVMNANPFTLGHQYLVERAAAENRLVHLFILSEDVSLVPFPVRQRLVREGTAHIKNICIHSSGPYIISSATFPSYFQKDEEAVIESHARLDLALFVRIAKALGITSRYVGEEPVSQVTGIYNQIMKAQLPQAGIRCVVIPRKESGGQAISASTVRKAIKERNLDLLSAMAPESTLRYFQSPEAGDVAGRIQAAKDVIHY